MEALIGLDFKNFQSLRDTSIDLPGAGSFSVIVGPSNLGKSAALRALKALVYNTPATGLISEGAKEFETTAWFADGQKISLVKGKNKSEYYLNDTLYAKSGANEAPAAIKEHWNIATPDGRQLCFASQHEPPFLLAEPASAVSKVLGDLTNASLLMEAVGQANKKRQAASNDAKARQREVDEARDEILTHAGLTARGNALKAARQAYSAAQERVLQWQQLVQLSDAFTKLEHEQKINTETLTKLTESNVNVSDLIEQATQAVNKVVLLEKIKLKHDELIKQAALNQDDVWHYADKIKDAEQSIHNLLDDAKYCPLCNQKIGK